MWRAVAQGGGGRGERAGEQVAWACPQGGRAHRGGLGDGADDPERVGRGGARRHAGRLRRRGRRRRPPVPDGHRLHPRRHDVHRPQVGHRARAPQRAAAAHAVHQHLQPRCTTTTTAACWASRSIRTSRCSRTSTCSTRTTRPGWIRTVDPTPRHRLHAGADRAADARRGRPRHRVHDRQGRNRDGASSARAARATRSATRTTAATSTSRPA